MRNNVGAYRKGTLAEIAPAMSAPPTKNGRTHAEEQHIDHLCDDKEQRHIKCEHGAHR
jgi:hypothetical protein